LLLATAKSSNVFNEKDKRRGQKNEDVKIKLLLAY